MGAPDQKTLIWLFLEGKEKWSVLLFRINVVPQLCCPTWSSCQDFFSQVARVQLFVWEKIGWMQQGVKWEICSWSADVSLKVLQCRYVFWRWSVSSWCVLVITCSSSSSIANRDLLSVVTYDPVFRIPGFQPNVLLMSVNISFEHLPFLKVWSHDEKCRFLYWCIFRKQEKYNFKTLLVKFKTHFNTITTLEYTNISLYIWSTGTNTWHFNFI